MAKKTTLFNSGMASLERLDVLLKRCNQHSTLSRLRDPDTGDRYNMVSLDVWIANIFAIYREIYPKLKEKEDKKIQELFDKLDSFGTVTKIMRTEEGNVRVILPQRYLGKWRVVAEIEKSLRKIADKKGMLLPDKPEWDPSMI